MIETQRSREKCLWYFLAHRTLHSADFCSTGKSKSLLSSDSISVVSTRLRLPIIATTSGNGFYLSKGLTDVVIFTINVKAVVPSHPPLLQGC